jgi:hypothetical protein
MQILRDYLFLRANLENLIFLKSCVSREEVYKINDVYFGCYSEGQGNQKKRKLKPFVKSVFI